MLLDQIVAIGRSGAKPAPRELAEVTAAFGDLHVDNNDLYRKRYAEILGLPLAKVGPGILVYAIIDSGATIHACGDLADAAHELMKRHVELYDREIAARYGVLAAKQGYPDPAEQLFGRIVIATMTGRIREDFSYAETCNTPFRGLAADATKLTLFRLIDAW